MPTRLRSPWARARVVATATIVVVFGSPSTGTLATVTCPALAATLTTTATLWNSDLRESSGIQSSLDHPGVLWIVQDSSNGPYLYAFSNGGVRLATYTLEGTGLRNVDWEAMGLDHRAGADRIYIGDIGDNAANRDGTDRPVPALYRLPEPEISATTSPPVVATISGVRKFKFRYFDSTNGWQMKPRDAEALFVDPRTRNIFVVLKDLKVLGGVSGIARVFLLRNQDLQSGTLNHAINVANPLGASAGVGTGPVAADISRDGRWIAVKNYQEGFLWPRARSETVAHALSGPAPCGFVVDGSEALSFEYESTAWTGLLSLKEDRDGEPPLRSVDRT